MARRSAEASLDLYEMAIIAQDMTGNYFFAYALIDALDE